MKASFFFPTPQKLDPFLDRQEGRDYSYTEVGQTRQREPKQYDNDHHSIILGKGEAVWEKAKRALENWQQFPAHWTKIYPNTAPLRRGTTVAVLFRVLGIWWTNSARIVYDFSDEKRFGFAYGTLPGHVETGEEVFWIERDETGEISYHIKAFSRPAYWFVWLGYPIARIFQRRFCRESMAQMKKLSTL